MNTPNFRLPYGTLALDGLDVAYVPESIHLAGDNEMGAELQMANHRIVHLAPGTAPTDAASLGQLTEQIATVEEYVDSREATLQGYVDTRVDYVQNQVTATDGNVDSLNTRLNTVADIVGSYTLIGIDVNGNPIRRLEDGVLPTDAANFGQVVAGDAAVTSAFIAADTVVTNARIAGDAAVTTAYIAADTVVTNARIAGDAAVTTAYIAADAAVTTAYIAADAVVTTNSVQKSGSALTGGLTWSGVLTPIQAVNTGALNINFGAGTVASPMPTTLALASNVVSILSFKDLIGTTKAFIRYLSDTNVIDISVNSVSMLTLNNTTATLGGTLACGGNRITGMGAPTADSDATTRLYVTNADSVVAANATADLTAEVNARVASVGAEATTRAAQDAAVIASSLQKSGGTMTGDLIMSGGNINMGTGYMAADLNMGTHKITGISAGVSGDDGVRYDQTVLRNGNNAMTGILNMGMNIIGNCGPASSPTDVVTYTQITSKFVPLTGGAAVGQAMTGQLYMGTNRIGNCGVALSAADVVVYSQIQQSTIPLTAWRVGETVQRKWYSPQLSNNLSNTTCGPSANVVIVTIDVPVTNGNKLFIGGQFNINANGYNDDQFTMRAGFGSQYMDFVNSMPTGVGFRERTYTFNTVFLANATATKTFSWKIFNESTTDTITISSLNWLFSIKEVQS